MSVENGLVVISVILGVYLLVFGFMKVVFCNKNRNFRKLGSASLALGISAVPVVAVQNPMYANGPDIGTQPVQDSDPWLKSNVNTKVSIATTTPEAQLEISNTDVGNELNIQPETLIYHVQSGDNLWSIAENHLKDGQEIISLWKQIIEMNKSNLVSRNPNLIYTGEKIVLPN